jgi:hypothetical protein
MKKQARKPAGAVSRKSVTEMFSYEGGRQVTVYIPPDPPEAIVFADYQRHMIYEGFTTDEQGREAIDALLIQTKAQPGSAVSTNASRSPTSLVHSHKLSPQSATKPVRGAC